MKHFNWMIITLLLVSCASRKQIATNPATLPVSTNMTDKQYKRYLNFVIDSMKIEAKKNKIETKYEYKIKHDSIYLDKVIYKFDTKRFKDSLNVIRTQLKEQTKQHKQDEISNRKEIKQTNLTDRAGIRQTEKTKRYRWWVWLIVGFSLGFVASKINFRGIITKLFLHL